MGSSGSGATLAQLRLLALGAFLTRLNGGRHEVLGGTYRGALATSRLVASFGVTDGASARALVEDAIARATTGVLPAWDLGRAVSWAGYMYVAWFLEVGEAWELVARAEAIARARYAGWEPFAVDYVRGRQDFMGKRGRGKDDEVAVAEWLLTAKKSPWILAPWDTPVEDAPPAVHVPRVFRVGKREPYATIAAALAEAAAGDTIELDAGTYREAVAPGRDVVLRARTGAKRPRVIAARGNALSADGVAVYAEGLTLRCDDPKRAAVCARGEGALVLRGAEVRAALHGIVALSSGTRVHLEDVRVAEVKEVGILASDHALVFARRTHVARGRIGVSVEAHARADLGAVTSAGAREAGLLVVGQAEVNADDLRVERAAGSGVQVSDGGTLSLSSSALAGSTGMRVIEATFTLDAVTITARKNGLELGEGGRGRATGLTVPRAGGSAVFVARGAHLELARSTLEGARFDGITCEGAAHLDDVTVRGAKRGAFYAEPGSRLSVLRSVATDVDVFARASRGARLALASATLRGARLGVAVEGGTAALESVWISEVREHALQIDGGTLIAGYLTVEGPNESPLVAAGGHATIATSRLLGHGEVHVAGAEVVLRRVTLEVTGDVGAAVHGGKLTLQHARVVAEGANGLEALGGTLTVEGSFVQGRECALVADGRARVHASRSHLVAERDVALELLGAARAAVDGVTASGAPPSRCARGAKLEGVVGARAASVVSVDLDGEGPLPFELLLHGDLGYSLIGAPDVVLGAHGERFVEAGGEPNGHAASAFVIAVVGAAFGRGVGVTADPEASLVSFVSADRDALLRLARAFREASAEAVDAGLQAVLASPP